MRTHIHLFRPGRKKPEQIYGSQPQSPITKAEVSHRMELNMFQRSLYSFRHRRPVYILASAAVDALAKALDDLGLRDSAQTTLAISGTINKAQIIRKERRNNLITRKEQLEKYRTLETNLATKIDASYVRDLRLVRNSVLAKNQLTIDALFLLVSIIGGLSSLAA